MVTLIKNKDHYTNCLEEIESLMDGDPDPTSAEGKRLSLLALLVKDYENQNFFFKKPSAIEAIKFVMDERNLKQVDLVPYIGSKSKVSEMLSGKRKLTVSMIRALNKYLNIPAEFLIQEEGPNEMGPSLTDLSVDIFPLQEVCNAGWITATAEEIKNKRERLVQKFLKPLGGLTPQMALFKRSFHKRVSTQEITGHLLVWTAKLLIEAEKKKVLTYSREKISKEFLKDVAKLSLFEEGPLLAVEYLARHGIKLVILPPLKGTNIDGGSLLDENGGPVIGLTLRYDRLDNFWFTLLHELAHVYKHLHESKKIYVDDIESGESKDTVEREADRLARESFIPRNMWKRSEAFNLQTEEAVRKFAHSLKIHPAIVAGRIRYETNEFSILTDLLGQGKIKKCLELRNENIRAIYTNFNHLFRLALLAFSSPLSSFLNSPN